jgi:hypothetical protein
MTFSRIDGLRRCGFRGFVSISALQTSRCSELPNMPGICLVVTALHTSPHFLLESVAGHFKGTNPTVPVSCLETKWVAGSLVLYIGKAGPGKTATFKSRVRSYLRFGRGRRAGHSGGRYIWQLQSSDNLLVCWKATPSDIDPRTVEAELIRELEKVYGKLPFANLKA